MTTKKTIAVIGATGSQGGSVVSEFLSLTDWTVRGVTRDVSSRSAKTLAAKGVGVVPGNLDDVASLKAAFKDTHAIYAVTDFWIPFFDAANVASAKRQDITINEFCYNLELQRGKNIAAAASGIPSLERFVLSTLSAAKELSGGKYKQILHFDSKAAVVSHIESEVPKLAAKMSTLQVGFYYVNLVYVAMMYPQKQHDGSFAYVQPCKADAKHPWTDVPADVGKFVKALVLEQAPGAKVLGYSQLASYEELASIWSEVTGKTCVVKQDSVQKLGALFPPIGEEGVEATAYSGEFGYDGSEKGVLTKEELGLTGTSDLKTWMQRQDWSAVIG